MIEAPNVETLMAGGLGEWLASQENVRAEAKRTGKQRITWGLIGGAVVFVVLLVAGAGFGWAFGGAALLAGGGFAWANAATGPVIASIKQQMNNRIANALGLEFSAAATPGPEFQLGQTYELLPSHDRSHFEDHWHGSIGAMPFSLYEAKLEEWRGSGKDRRLETVFRGIIMQIGFARDFHGVTLVERAGQHMTLFGLRDSISIEGRKLERVKMVDPRFEDSFTCWSSDQVEARYLVHPAYVERLITLEQSFHGKKIRTLFHGGNVVIVLESNDLFESGSLDASADRRLLEETINHFVALANLAHTLNERPRG